MTLQVPDRFKAANAFWIGLAQIGLTIAAILSQARLPLTIYDGKKNLVTTAQFFALWRAVGELSADPAWGPAGLSGRAGFGECSGQLSDQTGKRHIKGSI